MSSNHQLLTEMKHEPISICIWVNQKMCQAIYQYIKYNIGTYNAGFLSWTWFVERRAPNQDSLAFAGPVCLHSQWRSHLDHDDLFALNHQTITHKVDAVKDSGGFNCISLQLIPISIRSSRLWSCVGIKVWGDEQNPLWGAFRDSGGNFGTSLASMN